MDDGERLTVELPAGVARVLDGLARAGAEAVLVGGCVRDLLRGSVPGDWDVATSAPPEEVVRCFDATSWRNPFGTVTVRQPDGGAVEVTTYRVEGAYHDRRRPQAVRWGTSLEEDLARRDFTINAMAWRALEPVAAGRVTGRLIDPHGGARDLDDGVLRAVGDPQERLAEDALRMLRAVRFATRFGLRLQEETAAAVRRHAPHAARLSGERVRDELVRIVGNPAPPSRAVRLMEELGLLPVLLPELAALRGVPQAKAVPGDALDHSLRTVDALPPSDPILRLAGLLHDLGKATTLANGHFIGHEREGAVLAERVAGRLRLPHEDVERVVRLVRHHMFAYTPDWTDAAVRRFIRRAGPDLLPDLFALRRADDRASGLGDDAAAALDELERRAGRLAADPIATRELAVDGGDLMRELRIPPGPTIGRLLRQLLEAVVEDPTLNRREALLVLARKLVADPAHGARTHRVEPGPAEASD